MKHFIIIITYTASPEIMARVRPGHKKFALTGYESGKILYSGPMNSKTGGIIAARGESKEVIMDFFSSDPYLAKKVAEYNFIEFDPVHSQEFLKDWIV